MPCCGGVWGARTRSRALARNLSVDWARALTGSKNIERRRSASPYWDDRQDDDLAMMHGDTKHTSWKRDSGEGAGGSELSRHEGAGDVELSIHDEDHFHSGSEEDEDLSQFEDQTFEAESFVSTECPSIRLHYTHTHTHRHHERASACPLDV